MIAFAVIAVVMVAIALAWIIVPLLRQRGGEGIAGEASNIALLRDQRRELDTDLANGTLSREHYDNSRRELEQRVLEEAGPALTTDAATPTGVSRMGRRTAVAMAAVVPVAALLLYVLWGNHDAFSPIAQFGDGQHAVSAAQMDAMVAKLAARLEQEPDNVQGWVVLARSYYAMNRYPDAARAFERVVKLLPNDANALADYADALAATQRSLQGKPTELVQQALTIDPGNWKALALAGTAAFDRKDFRQAVAYWETLKQRVPPEVAKASAVDASINEARQLAGMPPTPVAAVPGIAAARAPGDAGSGSTAATAAPVNAATPPGGGIEGVVKLSPQLAARASPDDTVFIFARAANGPRMPLAVMRRQVKDLPATFRLDDSMAMSPDRVLSSVAQIVVGARVSKSGNAIAQSGDLEGTSAPVKIGATGLDIVIDRAVP